MNFLKSLGVIFLLLSAVILSACGGDDTANKSVDKENSTENEVEQETLEDEDDDDSDAEEIMVDLDAMTATREEAIDYAMQLVDKQPISRETLSRRLEGEGFSTGDVNYAIGYIVHYNDVDFKELAVKRVEDILDSVSLNDLSREGIIYSLIENSKFTKKEAKYAMDYVDSNNNVDWLERAVAKAENALTERPTSSKSSLIEYLVTDDKYTKEEAEYAVNYVDANNTIDWQERANELVSRNAARHPENYTDRSRTIDWVIERGYTEEQAIIAVDNAGIK